MWRSWDNRIGPQIVSRQLRAQNRLWRERRWFFGLWGPFEGECASIWHLDGWKLYKTLGFRSGIRKKPGTFGLLLRKCGGEMHILAHKQAHCDGARGPAPIQKWSWRISSTQVNLYSQTIGSQIFQTTFSTVCAWMLQKHVKCTHLIGRFG